MGACLITCTLMNQYASLVADIFFAILPIETFKEKECDLTHKYCFVDTVVEQEQHDR